MKKQHNRYFRMGLIAMSLLLVGHPCLAGNAVVEDTLWITYKGGEGAGKGKHIVLISGDEEYRSEEALPALGKLLSEKHGFDCTVLFAIDSNSGMIDPSVTNNIPGMHLLEGADLMVLFTRFRNLPPGQMTYFENYLAAGKPIVALRTATHAFNFPKESPFFKYSYNSSVPGWEGGFGKVILGETWISHHGDHGKEGTLTGKVDSAHPILTGVGSIWVPTDVYTVNPPTDANVLLLGYVTSGMDAKSPVNKDKPAMPVAWTRLYEVTAGIQGRVFTTTMGSSVDLLDQDFRRLLVNAIFWSADLAPSIQNNLAVEFDDHFQPTMFGFDSYRKNIAPFQKR